MPVAYREESILTKMKSLAEQNEVSGCSSSKESSRFGVTTEQEPLGIPFKGAWVLPDLEA